MRILIRHEIIQTYTPSEKSLVQLLRLHPRDCESQLMAAWQVDFDRDCRQRETEDAFGNCIRMLWADGPVVSLKILARGEVETFDTAGIVRGLPDPLPPELYLRMTAMTAPSPALRDFAHASIRGARTELDRPHHLMRAVHEAVHFSSDSEPADNAAAALERGSGPGQDGTHVFITSARILGIPARCVSGYLIHDEQEEGDTQPAIHGAHVWPEAYVDGLGWIGFDPSLCLCMHDGHVRVAHGLDYPGTSPLRMPYSGGGRNSHNIKVIRAPGPVR